MSEVTENQGGLTAGNTNANLAGTDRDAAIAAGNANLPSASDLDTVAAEVQTSQSTVSSDAVEDILDEENTFDVSRAEFNELQDAFIRLTNRIAAYNVGSPHKI